MHCLAVVVAICLALVSVLAFVSPTLASAGSSPHRVGTMGPTVDPGPRPSEDVGRTIDSFATNVSWTNISPFLQPAPWYTQDLAFDSATNSTILYAPSTEWNVTSGPFYPPTTWSYRAGAWTNITPPVIDQAEADPFNSVMTYDGAATELVLVGCGPQSSGQGCTGAAGSGVGTWTWDGRNWSNLTPGLAVSPPAGFGDGLLSPIVYDAAAGYALFVDANWTRPNGNTTTTWTFANQTWTNITSSSGLAPPASGAALTYDPTLGCAVLFGGWYDPYVPISNQTWEFCNGTWSEVPNGRPNPPPLYNAAFAFDPTLGGDLLWGGGNANVFENSTWLFKDGNWSQLNLTGSPPPNLNGFFVPPAVAYDAADKYLLILGGFTLNFENRLTQCCSLAWGLGQLPPFARLYAAPNPVEVGQAVVISTTVVGGVAPDRFSYSGLPNGCASSDVFQFRCVPSAPGNFSVSVNVEDSLGRMDNVSVLLDVASGLAANLTLRPAGVDLGQSANVTVGVFGGVAPFTVLYGELPPGCSPPNGTQFDCIPTEAGNYTINVEVQDSEGVLAYASATLAVYGDPSVTALKVSPSAIDLGAAASVQATVAGGAPPLAYTYADLPPGCIAVDVANFTCTPSSHGSYTLNLTVTDSVGLTASASTTWVVYPALTITAVNVSPMRPIAGSAVNLSVWISGGDGPYSVAWGGLNSSVQLRGASVTWTPMQPGNYSVKVVVSDATGFSTVRTVDILVAAPIGSAARGGVPIWSIVAAGVGGAAVALFLVDVLVRRKRRRRDTTTTGSGSEPGPRTKAFRGRANRHLRVATPRRHLRPAPRDGTLVP
jgi:hypothetical protein